MRFDASDFCLKSTLNAKNFQKIVTHLTKCCYNAVIEKRDVGHKKFARLLCYIAALSQFLS